MSVEINKNSRLNFHELTIIQGVELWAFEYEPIVEKSLDDTQYPMKEIESLDGVARSFYKNDVLWWILAKTNKITDVFIDTELYIVEWDIPTYDTDGELTGTTISKSKNFKGLLSAQMFVEDLRNKGMTGEIISKTAVINIPTTTRALTEIL